MDTWARTALASFRADRPIEKVKLTIGHVKALLDIGTELLSERQTGQLLLELAVDPPEGREYADSKGQVQHLKATSYLDLHSPYALRLTHVKKKESGEADTHGAKNKQRQQLQRGATRKRRASPQNPRSPAKRTRATSEHRGMFGLERQVEKLEQDVQKAQLEHREELKASKAKIADLRAELTAEIERRCAAEKATKLSAGEREKGQDHLRDAEEAVLHCCARGLQDNSVGSADEVQQAAARLPLARGRP